jgi:hypothetical protein
VCQLEARCRYGIFTTRRPNPPQAKRFGYYVKKSREWVHVPHCNNYGEYMLVGAQNNVAVLGWNYDADLEEISEFLQAEQDALVVESLQVEQDTLAGAA